MYYLWITKHIKFMSKKPHYVAKGEVSSCPHPLIDLLDNIYLEDRIEITIARIGSKVL